MSTFIQDLSHLSEIDLIRLYRNEKDEKRRSKIFEVYLLKNHRGSQSWHERILYCVYKHKTRLETNGCYFNTDDLYQDICYAIMKALEKWIDVDVKTNCVSYVMRVINSYCNRTFNYQNTFKRHMLKSNFVDVNGNVDESNEQSAMFCDVISTENIGKVRSIKKELSFENALMFKDMIEYLKKSLKPSPLPENIPKSLVRYLMIAINKKKRFNVERIAKRYKLNIDQFYHVKNLIQENIEKKIYIDMIILMQKDLNENDILIKKYKCSRVYIKKIKQKFATIAQKKFKSVGVYASDCFIE